MSTRRDFLKYSAAASASGLLPFSMKAPAAVKSGSSLSVAIFADPLTFDPHLAGNLQGRATTQAIHDTLLTVDKDGRLAPNLAQIRNPDTGSIRGGEIGTLDTVEVVDSHTIKLTLKNAFAAFLFPLIDVSGCIASPTALEKWGKDYGLHPAGTGPFKAARDAYRHPRRGRRGREPAHLEGLDGDGGGAHRCRDALLSHRRLLVYIVALRLKWLPASGFVPLYVDPIASLETSIQPVLPNTFSPIIVQASLGVGFAIILESSLSFIGLGAQPPTPSWGNMVQVGFQYLEIAPWFALVPAAAIFVAVLGFNMLGDGLRDVLDPQSHV